MFRFRYKVIIVAVITLAALGTIIYLNTHPRGRFPCYWVKAAEIETCAQCGLPDIKPQRSVMKDNKTYSFCCPKGYSPQINNDTSLPEDVVCVKDK
jgi:hypothetical protein